MKQLTFLLSTFIMLFMTNSFAQHDEINNTKTVQKKERKEKRKKPVKIKSTKLPRNSSTAYFTHLGEDNFTVDNIARHYSDIPFYEWTLSGGISTLGLTLEALTPISKGFKLRAGIDLFYYNSKHYEIGLNDVNGQLRQAFGFKPNLAMKGKAHLLHGHALIDYYPVADGLFFITGGVYVGQSGANLNGYFINYEGEKVYPIIEGNWPDIDFQGNTIKTTDGNIAAKVTMGNTIKPYLGIGLGKVVTNKRIGFSIEAGMLYQGDYKITQDGQQVSFEPKEDIIYNEKAEKWLDKIQWWPKVSFQIRYRLF